jgi:FtsP/CotA-like multicopper oxidase with cupredoxin domain
MAAWLAAGSVATANHPFHLHVNHFQIVAIHAPQAQGGSAGLGAGGAVADATADADGTMAAAASVDYEVGDWRDTITLPTPGSVTVRWRADDYVGRAMAHCHIFGHSDTGMSLDFEVVHPE